MGRVDADRPGGDRDDAVTPQQGSMQGRTAPHLPETPADRGMGSLAKTDVVPSRESKGGDVNLHPAPVFEYRFL
jgi:hypothetical protein